MKNIENNNLISIYQAILALENYDEVERFLRDLLTEEELNEVKKRWQTAQMLDQGVSYVDIEKKTGLSSTTVARVSKWLKKGMNGYRLVLDRLHHHNSSSIE
jgi:TrpR-related protein YerC/YecD